MTDLPLPEPEGWTFQHEDTGRMTTLENDGVNNPENFARNNPRFQLCEALYSEKGLHAYAAAKTAEIQAELVRAEKENAVIRGANILADDWAKTANARIIELETECARLRSRITAGVELDLWLANNDTGCRCVLTRDEYERLIAHNGERVIVLLPDDNADAALRGKE